MTFDLNEFLEELFRITSGTIIIFCGIEQVSEICRFFANKQKKNLGTVRQLIWCKTNPSPMNGDYVYLSATENAIWFRKRGATFNAHCKKNYFTYSLGSSKLHPTMKNIDLIKELILDNSNEGQLVFDPCSGSGTTLVASKNLNRNFLGFELDSNYYEVAKNRLFNTVDVVKGNKKSNENSVSQITLDDLI